MLRNLLLAVLLVFGTVSLSYSQISCPGGLTVEIEGSTTDIPLNIEGTATQPLCNESTGALTGSVEITVTGGSPGTPAYTYQWTMDGTNFSTDEDLFNLGTGTYAVTATDTQGCTVEGEWIITEPTPIEINPDLVHLDCNSASGPGNGAISVDPTGGTPFADGSYSYNWESSTGGTGLDQTAQNQTLLSAGTYQVTVTDENGCTATGEYILTEPDAIDAVATAVPLSCHEDSGVADGSVTLVVIGGDGDYSYTWETTDGSGLEAGAQNQTGLSAGTYNLTITDGLGCVLESFYVLTQPDPVAIDATPVNLDCNAASGDANGSIGIVASGGQGSAEGDYTYTWATSNGSGLAPGEASQTGLSAGTYSLTVTDSNNCTATAEWTLTQPEAVVADGTPVNLDCHSDSGDANGSITMAPTGGDGNYSYNWETTDGSGLTAGAGTQTGLSAGTYNVTATDGLGCEDTNSFTLTQPEAVVADGTPVNLDCNAASGDANGTITMAPTGGDGNYSYNWETTDGSGLTAGAGTQTGLSAGTYNVTVTDGLGCEDTNSFTLTQPEAVVADGTPVNPGCNAASGDADGTITMAPTGGDGNYSYNWETTDGSGLTAGAGTQTGLSAGTYNVTVTDGLGCEDTNSFTLTQPEAVTCSLDSPTLGDGTSVACYDDEAVITVTPGGGTGAYTYTLSGTDYEGNPVNIGPQSETTFTVPAGTYTVTTVDANGCSSTCDIVITQPEPLIAGTCTTDDECQVGLGEIEVEVAGGVGPYTVTWTSVDGTLDQGSQVIPAGGGSVIFTGADGGATYIFQIEDENGCIIGG